ncbi:MAG: response regulator [Verrucomicrobiaceae bacterium]|nr:MAG: response regulator [Verrucomicrobiaceae bacterium]
MVRLPMCEAPAPSSTPEKPDAPLFRSARILVIDDNVDAAEMMAMLQGLRGHVTRVAHSGPDGLEAAKDFQPDVVLLDIGLPGMDGYEVARHLRTMSETSNVRIIAMSGYGSDEDIARGKEAGFDEHLVKPVETAVLNQHLDASLKL